MGASAEADERFPTAPANPSSLARDSRARQASKVEAECPNWARSVLCGGM